jgi:hypothetical protein
MPTKLSHAIIAAGLMSFLLACSPRKFTSNYYFRNEKVLDRIEENYKQLYTQTPFTVGFTDKEHKTISLEIITDTLSYIYEFSVQEPRLADTLNKYNIHAARVISLVQQMQAIRCTWIKNFEYYVDEKKNSLIFMSVKPVPVNRPFSYKKYYILTYFPKAQSFDSTGQLLDNKKQRRLRKINGEVFRRIDDKVCYTISGNFR